jgi:Carbohydrate esterase, sialic acid-specific acetylesterase
MRTVGLMGLGLSPVAAVQAVVDVTPLADYFFDDFDGSNVSLTGRSGWTAYGDADRASKIRADGGAARMTTGYNGESPWGYQVAAANLSGSKTVEFDYDFTQDAAANDDATNPWQFSDQVWYLSWQDQDNNMSITFDSPQGQVRATLTNTVGGVSSVVTRYTGLPTKGGISVTLSDRVRLLVDGVIWPPDQLYFEANSVYPDRLIPSVVLQGGLGFRHLFYPAAYSRYVRVNPLHITITDPQKFFGRDELLGRDVVIAGTYSGTPTSWVIRRVNAATGAEGDWRPLDVQASAGVWNASVRFETGRHRVDVGWVGSDGFARTVRSSEFAVGPLIFYYGQSNAAGSSDRGAVWVPGSNAGAHCYNMAVAYNGTSYQRWWQDTERSSNDYVINSISLADTLSRSLGGVPVGVAGAGVPATELAQLKPGTNAWEQTLVPHINRVGGNVEHYVWSQGEAEALSSSDYSSYVADFDALVGGLRVVGGRPDAGVFLRLIGQDNAITESAATTARAAAVRAIQMSLENPADNIWVASHPLGVPLTDTIHFTHAGHIELCRREGLTVARRAYGALSYDGRGPVVTGGTRSGAVITLTLDLNGATSVSGTGLTGYAVSADNFATTLAISSVNVIGNSIVITMASAPPGAVKVSSYREGNYDDSSIAIGAYSDGKTIPVMPIATPISVA